MEIRSSGDLMRICISGPGAFAKRAYGSNGSEKASRRGKNWSPDAAPVGRRSIEPHGRGSQSNTSQRARKQNEPSNLNCASLFNSALRSPRQANVRGMLLTVLLFPAGANQL